MPRKRGKYRICAVVLLAGVHGVYRALRPEKPSENAARLRGPDGRRADGVRCCAVPDFLLQYVNELSTMQRYNIFLYYNTFLNFFPTIIHK